MASSAKLIVKANADKGNTVLFRTTDTGGDLQISIDGVQWFTVGGEKAADGVPLYEFIAPLGVSTNREVSLRLAVSDTVVPGESYRVVAVGSTDSVIGYNLLPEPLKHVKDLWDDNYIVLPASLPADLLYKSSEIPMDMIPVSVALWGDDKVIDKNNLPIDIPYLVNGKIPEELVPSNAADVWEDLTDGVPL